MLWLAMDALATHIRVRLLTITAGILFCVIPCETFSVSGNMKLRVARDALGILAKGSNGAPFSGCIRLRIPYIRRGFAIFLRYSTRKADCASTSFEGTATFWHTRARAHTHTHTHTHTHQIGLVSQSRAHAHAEGGIYKNETLLEQGLT